jgi:TonB-dependent SusC/RagA subfamily outer membrane receptor
MKQVGHTISKKYFKAILFLLVLGFASSGLMAKSTLLKEQKISLDLKEVSLSEVLFKIESITDFRFFYKNDDVDLDRKVTIKVNKASIKMVLSKLFKNGNLDFYIVQHQIILKKSYLRHQKKYKIQGRVIDKETGEGVPFCNIVIGNTYTGTSSNELGGFVIYLESLPSTLVFTHINYQGQVVTVSKTADIVVELSPLTHTLKEVTLQTKGNDGYAVALANKAFQKISKLSYSQKYGRALYRQKAKNGKNYSEFLEIIFDIRYNTAGIEDWEIIEGRYALKKNSINNKNFTLLSRLVKSFQPDTNDLIFPLRTNLENFYKVRVLDVMSKTNNKIAVLQFTPRRLDDVPIFKGKVYINTRTYDVLKVTGTIVRDDIKLIRLTKKHSSKKNYTLSYEMVFKKDPILNLVIDYIKVDQEFDYYEEKRFQTHLSSTSNLSFFQYYTPTKRIKLGNRFKRNSSDWERLNKIGYDEEFWEANPIVKRTPIEKEVIDAFEKDNIFESIFINSRQQIAMLQSDLVDDPFIKELTKTVRDYNNFNAVEKVYLHTDRDIAATGEELWYSAYTVLGPNHYFSIKSKVLHVDLINAKNEIISTQIQELKNGRGKGSVQIPKNLPSGIYQLRAYTNWMRNFDDTFFFYKTVRIINNQIDKKYELAQHSQIDLQFFPEGGDAIVNLKSKIAFKAIGNDGLGKKVTGKIIDSKNKRVANLNAIDRGAGIFYLQPKEGESYIAVLDDNSTYPLPKVKNQGYVMAVDNRSSRTIKVKILASQNLKNKPFYVLGHMRNKKYYQGKFEFGGAAVVDFEIPKNRLPSGVMTLILFDSDKKPQSERIVFVNNQEELVIQTKLHTTSFKARDKVVLDVLITDTDGRPVFTDFSIAVTDAGRVPKETNAANVLSYFLLQSEVKGNIENPASFFKDQKPATRSRLDLVMLTHGWRRFNWEKIQQQRFDSIKKFPFYEGLSISGTAKTLYNHLLTNATLDMITGYNDKYNIEMYTTKTDSKGRFVINNVNYGDSLKLVFNAYRNKKPIDVQILLDKRKNTKATLPLPHFNSLKQSVALVQKEKEKKYIEISALKQQADSIFRIKYGEKEPVKLKEVVVQAKRAEKRRAATESNYGVTPDATLYMEDYPPNRNFLYLLGNLSGVKVSGSGPNTNVQIRNLGTPLWIVDGVYFESESNEPDSRKGFGSISAKPVPDAIRNLNAFDIERVEVLKGPSTAIYGMRGAGGVIIIYTKRGTNYDTDILSPEFTMQGYSATREFYVPKYDKKLEKRAIPDYRTTLYWNPSVSTDINGKASLIFYNSDTATQFQIAIESLSIFGVPGTFLQTVGKKR